MSNRNIFSLDMIFQDRSDCIAFRGCSIIMLYRLGVGGVSQSMTHYDREGGGGKTNYDV